VWSKIGNDLASPVTTDALTPLLIGTGLSVTLFALKSEISHPFQQSISTRRPLDGLAKLGDWGGKVYPNLIYTGYAALAGALGSERGYLRAEEMVAATAYSGAVTSLLKVTFREGRPNNPVDKKSMPSGHATTAFAFAGVVGAEHPWYVAVPAYTLATITAYSRINDNKHYLHDVVAGATIGLSYALGVYYRRLDKENSYFASKKSLWPTFSLLPAENMDGAVIGAAKLF
jgi:membrane-associated phospholipid phosphatase